MFITLMFDFHISRKKPLTIFLHAILCLNLTKPFHFKKQIVTGNRKWILYNNVEWKRSFSKRNETPPTTPKACLHSKQVMLYICWDWKGVLYNELLPENQMINSNNCRRRKRLRFGPWVKEIPWSRKWHPTPVFLPGKFHGQRSLVGHSP